MPKGQKIQRLQWPQLLPSVLYGNIVFSAFNPICTGGVVGYTNQDVDQWELKFISKS